MITSTILIVIIVKHTPKPYSNYQGPDIASRIRAVMPSLE